MRDVQESIGQARAVDEVGKDHRPEHHQEQFGRGQRGFPGHFHHHFPCQRPAEKRDGDGPGSAHACGFGRGEGPDIDAADHKDEQAKRGPDIAQRDQPFAPAGSFTSWPGSRVARYNEQNRTQVEQHADQAGQNPGDEQLAHRRIGDQAIDDKDNAGRD